LCAALPGFSLDRMTSMPFTCEYGASKRLASRVHRQLKHLPLPGRLNHQQAAMPRVKLLRLTYDSLHNSRQKIESYRWTRVATRFGTTLAHERVLCLDVVRGPPPRESDA